MKNGRTSASMARSMKEVHTINYYPINEGARRGKGNEQLFRLQGRERNGGIPGNGGQGRRHSGKAEIPGGPMYHEKIDHLLDTYARKLAENMNQGFAIDARVPSVMIAGPANFPVGKKEKQNPGPGQQHGGMAVYSRAAG